MKDQSYQSWTRRIGSCIIQFWRWNQDKECSTECVSVVFPAWYHCVDGVSMSRQVKITLYPPLITFFVAIFWCQDKLGRSSSWPQCPVSGLKQGAGWQSSLTSQAGTLTCWSQVRCPAGWSAGGQSSSCGNPPGVPGWETWSWLRPEKKHFCPCERPGRKMEICNSIS